MGVQNCKLDLAFGNKRSTTSAMDREPIQIKDRFTGVTVTLDASMNHGRALRTRSRTDPNLSLPDPLELSRLPPAVATVPKEDWKGYVHSKKVNNYLVGATLGEGSFAKVKEAFHVLVGEKVRFVIMTVLIMNEL